jgi:hypothetical protein
MSRYGDGWRLFDPPEIVGGTNPGCTCGHPHGRNGCMEPGCDCPEGKPAKKQATYATGRGAIVDNQRSVIDAATAKRYGVTGLYFHSKAEALRWIALLTQQDAGLICDLKRQHHFPLHVMNAAGLKQRVTVYIADFTYWEDGVFVVEDKKPVGAVVRLGRRTVPFRDPVYSLKKKMFEAEYAITIRET